MRATARSAPAAVLAAAFVALTGAASTAQEIGDTETGHDFARQVCAECHAVESDDAASPHPDAPPFPVIAAVPGMTATALFVILRNPHRQMPDLILTRDDMHDVAAYILSLKDGG